MTFKAKPVVKRAQRPSWEGQDRRNFYLNIGFGIVVAAAVVILLIAAGLTWYNDHLSPVGSVDGQSITKDDFRDRFTIETWRLDESERRIRTAVAAGQLTDAEGQTQLQVISQQRQQLAGVTLERLIDNKLQAKLAVEEGITVTPADVDARLLVEATKPESRHAWVIEVKPDPGSRRGGLHGRPEGRRQGQGGSRAQGPPGRQGLGAGRPDGLDRRVQLAAVGRPGLADGR